jgi:hypothetical protein
LQFLSATVQTPAPFLIYILALAECIHARKRIAAAVAD